MKKLLFTTCILLAGISTQAQQQPAPAELLQKAIKQTAPFRINADTVSREVLRQDSIINYNAAGVYSTKEVFAYDSITVFNRTETLRYNWDIAGNDWQKNQKTTYNTEASKTTETTYFWDDNTSTWKNSAKITCEYNGDGNKTTETSYTWDNTEGDWKESLQTEYEYDANNYNTQYTQYRWSDYIDDWNPSMQVEFTYDAAYNLTKETYYFWVAGTPYYWQQIYKIEHQDNLTGKESQSIYYVWDYATSVWIELSKFEYQYDIDGNQTAITLCNWDRTSSNWTNMTKQEYTYDENNLTESTVYQWSDITSDWQQTGSQLYYYSLPKTNPNPEPEPEPEPGTGLTPAASTPPLALYPNPAPSTVYLQGLTQPAQIAIYNTNGQLLQQQQVQPGAGIPVGNLSKGLYLLKVNDTILKLIKE